MGCRTLITIVALAGITAPVFAGILFNRNKKTPADQAAELVKTLRGERDERKRAVAAAELGKSDAKIAAQVLGALIETLERDPSQSVRLEAAQSLGKLRPIHAQAGRALYEAMESDPATRVRIAARSALAQYVAAGYRLPSPDAEATPPHTETPLATAPPQSLITERQPRSTPPPPPPPTPRSTARVPSSKETTEPPLAGDVELTAPPRILAPTPYVPINPSTDSHAKVPGVPEAPNSISPRVMDVEKPIASSRLPTAKPPTTVAPPTKTAAKPADPKVQGPMLNPPE